MRDVLFPPQENYGAFVTSNDKEYPSWFFENITRKELSSSIRLHGHTHPYFNTNPSGTDIDQFTDMMDQVDNYMIQLILSNSQDPHCALWTRAEDGTILVSRVNISWQFEEKMYRVLEKVTQKVKPRPYNYKLKVTKPKGKKNKKKPTKRTPITPPHNKRHYDLFNLVGGMSTDGDA